jgi:hypothetical protein
MGGSDPLPTAAGGSNVGTTPGSKYTKAPSDPFNSVRGTLEFDVARYEQLQQAWMKRIELEYQLIGVTLVLMGTSLSIGLQFSQWVLLLYPLVAVCLGAICLDNNIKLREIKKLTGDHDENQIQSTPLKALFKRWMGLAVLVLIVSTEFISVILAILYHHPKFAEDIGWYILFILDVFALAGSICLVVYMQGLCAEQY